MKTLLGTFIKGKLLPSIPMFLIMMGAITALQALFGPSNNITAVAVLVLLLSVMGQDVRGAPARWLALEFGALVLIGAASCAVCFLTPIAALPVHFVTLFLLTYGFTYAEMPNQYFPYLLTYLFLVLLAPVTLADIPLRFGCLLFGGALTFALQMLLSRRREPKAARAALTATLRLCRSYMSGAPDGQLPDWPAVLTQSRTLAAVTHQHRAREGRLSAYGAAALDCVNTLEHVLAQLQVWMECGGAEASLQAERVVAYLDAALTEAEGGERDAALLEESLSAQSAFPAPALVCWAEFCRRFAHLQKETDSGAMPGAERSLGQSLRDGLSYSTVRAQFALRMALSVSVALLVVGVTQVPYGKWVVFPIFSLGFPYAQDVWPKIKDRTVALVLSGVFYIPLFYLLPDPGARGLLLMGIGFLSLMSKDYRYTFTCACVSALGSNGLTTLTTPGQLGGLWAVRLGLNLVGILVALVVYYRICPYGLTAARDELLHRYSGLTGRLVDVCAQARPDDTERTWLLCQSALCESRLLELHQRVEPQPTAAQVQDLREQIHHALAPAHRYQESVV